MTYDNTTCLLNTHQLFLARKYSCIWRMNIMKKKVNYTLFSLVNYTTWIKVIEVYDGDTLKALMNFRNKIDLWTIRMHGYDSPEMKPLKTKNNRDKEIEMAKQSKCALENQVLNKNVFAKIIGFDKYGRLLAELFINKININQWMIQNNYGYIYSGGKKKE
jgi:endonuclease YncB( thermonuclease family)